MTVRLLVLDDHQLFREGLRSLFAHSPGVPAVSIVAEAGSAHEAFELVGRVECDVAIVDVALPGQNGISAIRELKRRGFTAPCLMVSAYAQPQLVAEAMGAGALGFALKVDGFEALGAAIRTVARGQRYLAPSLPASAVPERTAETAGGPLGPLSPREREVFELLVRGYSSPSLAKELAISVKTVEVHRTHIFRKLQVRGIIELVRYAAQHDLLGGNTPVQDGR